MKIRLVGVTGITPGFLGFGILLRSTSQVHLVVPSALRAALKSVHQILLEQNRMTLVSPSRVKNMDVLNKIVPDNPVNCSTVLNPEGSLKGKSELKI